MKLPRGRLAAARNASVYLAVNRAQTISGKQGFSSLSLMTVVLSTGLRLRSVNQTLNRQRRSDTGHTLFTVLFTITTRFCTETRETNSLWFSHTVLF